MNRTHAGVLSCVFALSHHAGAIASGGELHRAAGDSVPARNAPSGAPAPGGAFQLPATTPLKTPAEASLVTDPLPVFSVPVVPRPALLVPQQEPTFGTRLTRIAGNAGTPLGTLPGTWGTDSRHVYSKQQPWNSDQSLLVIENRGGSPSPLVLDGKTYAPRQSLCPSLHPYDYRWHPSREHASELIDVDGSGTELRWLDVRTCTRTRSWTLPLTSDYGIGSGEGNPSSDGRFVAVGNNQAMVVVDMDPRPPFLPYPSKRIGPVYTFPPCSLGVVPCQIDWVSISPSGKYVVVKYSGVDSTADAHRVYEVDPNSLALKPHVMAAGSVRCGSFAKRPNGWIFPLKHADMALDPFDQGEDIIVGGRACPGSSLGHVLKVRLRDGRLTALTDPSNESSVYHVSTRNLDRPGWAYVGYYPVSGKRFNDEIVAVKLDGSRAVERYGHTHTEASGCYRCESHPVPSRDGRRVLFASNWARACGLDCGPLTEIKDHVLEDPFAPQLDVLAPLLDVPALALERLWPNPGSRLPMVLYSLPGSGPVTLELLDLAGRRVLFEHLGAPGPGSHVLNLDRHPKPRPGMYWVRLQQDGSSVTRSIVLSP